MIKAMIPHHPFIHGVSGGGKANQRAAETGARVSIQFLFNIAYWACEGCPSGTKVTIPSLLV